MSLPRVAVLSDIHGNYHAFNSVIGEIENQEIEKIIVVGDSTGPTMQNKIFKILLQKKALLIRGNGEKRVVNKNRGQIPDYVWKLKHFSGNRWIHTNLKPEYHRVLEFLPDQRIVNIQNTSPLRVVHGSPHDTKHVHGILPEQSSTDSQKLMKVFRTIGIQDAIIGLKEKVLICGHTHRPWTQKIGNIQVVNPGSVGAPANGDPRADYAVLSWTGNEWNIEHHTVSYDLEKVHVSLLESGILGKLGAYARITLINRMTGIDASMEFLLHMNILRRSNRSMDSNQLYVHAETTFDWEKYEKKFQ